MVASLARTVVETASTDAGRGIARLDPEDLAALQVSAGGIIEISAKRTTYARAMPIPAQLRGQARIALDGVTRANANTLLAETVTVRRAEAPPAKQITIALDSGAAFSADAGRRLSKLMLNRPVVVGDQARLGGSGRASLTATIAATEPQGPVLFTADTKVSVAAAGNAPKAISRGPSFDDLGGLSKQIARVREMIELPIRRPELFSRLGIEAPKGVLLSGPPGTGKTLLARAVAAESGASFHQIDGPEIISKHYGDSEAHLRSIFERAEARAPAIIFIDEIDAIAPKRGDLGGDRQLERRVVAQLLTLMDGLSGRGQVVVMAATNMPDALDEALRRPGRFDREIRFTPPDKISRREILGIQTHGVPLAADVDLDAIAASTHGFVGADLAALVREAGMAALRRISALEAGHLTRIDPELIFLEASDFEVAQKELIPSAIREVFTEVPDVSWNDVGGHDDIKQTLIEAVLWPLAYPDLFRSAGVRPAKGVILHGPPGTGKTLLAKALASEAKVNFISVRGPELLDKFMGESERAIRSIFAKARATSPCILFFDELDALAPQRSTSGAVMDRVVSQMLTEIDGVTALADVFLFAATNRIDMIDSALLRPGRFDIVFSLPAPDVTARRAILEIHGRDLPLHGDVSLADLADATDGFTGADIEQLLQASARRALRRHVEGGSEGSILITTGDIDAARAAFLETRRPAP